MFWKRVHKWVLKNKLNLLVFFISLIVTVFAIEFVNYLFVGNSGQYSVWPPGLSKTFLPDPEIFQGIEGKSHFTINQLGYRGPMIKNKEGEYRILTIGGSTTESLYLDDEEAWPNLVMEGLDRTVDGKDVIVMNIGKSGHNSRDNILELKHLSSRYEPDLVIFMVGVNDMLFKLSKRWVWKPFDEESYDYTRVFSEMPGYTIKSSLSYKFIKLIYGSVFLGVEPQDEVGVALARGRMNRKSIIETIELPDLGPALEDYGSNLNRLIEISMENNVSVLFVTQPYFWKENMTEEEDFALWMSTDFNGNYYLARDMAKSMDMFNAKMLEVCLENPDILCLDLEEKVNKSIDYFYDDIHFNEKGAEFVAEEFVKYIKKNIGNFTLKGDVL